MRVAQNFHMESMRLAHERPSLEIIEIMWGTHAGR
jgi:hypothetical protein